MLTDQAAGAFRALTGTDPVGVWSGPGRINLIGEHTDYNDGFVLPFALPQAAFLAASPRTDGRWRLRSVDLDDTVELGLDELVPGTPGWHSYLAGVVWALREAGHEVVGADLVLTSDVPLGAGLSSSAAIECAALTALADLNGLDIAPMDRAKLARVAENAYVGAPTGLLDQAASTLCVADHALFLDCRTLETQQVPLAVTAAGLEILVIDTRTRHSHVDGEYAARRASCEEACRLLGVPALRDVTDLDDALARLPEQTGRRVRHVVTENQRVLDAMTALAAGDYPGLGRLMTASHASMRDDYEITEASVDLAVEVALAEGALGARMTGGGFGGCVLALVSADRVDAVSEAVIAAFAAAGLPQPVTFLGRPSAGARRVR
ncbi:Galactokinase [Propionicimonas sp. T2.31MG-18]|uniref:galactokinase n=1 Tax=Propionicimonas sp. T2.31MG-18 TaxID=3157620 RepID=UPI0035E7A114